MISGIDCRQLSQNSNWILQNNAGLKSNYKVINVEFHPACLSENELLSDCDFERTRRGGPGGQHRNKVDSAIVVTHRNTGVSAQASERRSQHENRSVAIQRLRINLAIEVRFERDLTSSELWRSRCQSGRISVSPSHSDFPCLMAEALDQIYQHNLQMAEAAKTLKCSTSQLIKFVKQETAAFAQLNGARKLKQMPALR